MASRLEAIASRLEAIASGLEAIASRLEAIASRLEVIASRLEAIASRLEAIASRLEVIASRLEAIASRLEASRLESIASRLEAPASRLDLQLLLVRPTTGAWAAAFPRDVYGHSDGDYVLAPSQWHHTQPPGDISGPHDHAGFDTTGRRFVAPGASTTFLRLETRRPSGPNSKRPRALIRTTCWLHAQQLALSLSEV